MAEKPNEALMRSDVCADLNENINKIMKIMNAPPNKDIIMREFTIGGVQACLVFMDGMAGRDTIDEFILQPCMRFAGKLDMEADHYVDYLMTSVLEIDDATPAKLIKEVIEAVLSGKSVLFISGSCQALLLETRSYEKRAVNYSRTESVVQGPQEGFVENLKTNMSLIRRIIRSETLVCETIKIGKKLPTDMVLMYLKGVAKEETVNLIKQRINSLDTPQCPGSGYLQQLIEDHPYSVFPQMLQTERPDRAASCLSDGQIVLFVDGSPYALAAPITFFHLLHAPDDTFMRWQYGVFVRIIRMLGIIVQ